MLVQAKKKCCVTCKDHLGAGQVPGGLASLLREALSSPARPALLHSPCHGRAKNKVSKIAQGPGLGAGFKS